MPVLAKKPHKHSASISIFKHDNKSNHTRSNSLDAANNSNLEFKEPPSTNSESEIHNQMNNKIG